MPRGGKRPGAGRKPGVPNKATADIKAAAQLHTADMLAVLVTIAKGAKSPPQARVAAAKTVIEFGHGKAAQALTGPEGEALKLPTVILHKLE